MRSGTSYRDIAARFSLEDFEVEALVRPHIRRSGTRRPKHPQPTPTHAFLTAANGKVVGG